MLANAAADLGAHRSNHSSAFVNSCLSHAGVSTCSQTQRAPLCAAGVLEVPGWKLIAVECVCAHARACRNLDQEAPGIAEERGRTAAGALALEEEAKKIHGNLLDAVTCHCPRLFYSTVLTSTQTGYSNSLPRFLLGG